MFVDYWSLWSMWSQVFQGSIAENCGRSIFLILLIFYISPSRILYWSVNSPFLFLLASFETEDTRDLGTHLEEQKGWVRHIKESLQWEPKSPLLLFFVITTILCRRTDMDGRTTWMVLPWVVYYQLFHNKVVLGLTPALLLCRYHWQVTVWPV